MMAPWANRLNEYWIEIEKNNTADALGYLLKRGGELGVGLPDIPENMDNLPNEEEEDAMEIEPEKPLHNGSMALVPYVEPPISMELNSSNIDSPASMALVPYVKSLTSMESNSSNIVSPASMALLQASASVSMNLNVPALKTAHSSFLSGQSNIDKVGMVSIDHYDRRLLRAMPQNMAGRKIASRRQSTAGGKLFELEHGIVESGDDYFGAMKVNSLIKNSFDPFQRISIGQPRQRSSSVNRECQSLYTIIENDEENHEPVPMDIDEY